MTFLIYGVLAKSSSSKCEFQKHKILKGENTSFEIIEASTTFVLMLENYQLLALFIGGSIQAG